MIHTGHWGRKPTAPFPEGRTDDDTVYGIAYSNYIVYGSLLYKLCDNISKVFNVILSHQNLLSPDMTIAMFHVFKSNGKKMG